MVATVSGLIKHLQEYPDDMQVLLKCNDRYCAELQVEENIVETQSGAMGGPNIYVIGGTRKRGKLSLTLTIRS